MVSNIENLPTGPQQLSICSMGLDDTARTTGNPGRTGNPHRTGIPSNPIRPGDPAAPAPPSPPSPVPRPPPQVSALRREEGRKKGDRKPTDNPNQAADPGSVVVPAPAAEVTTAAPVVIVVVMVVQYDAIYYTISILENI